MPYQDLAPGAGYVNISSAYQNLVPGAGYINEYFISLTLKRAIVLYSGILSQLLTADIGTGKKPIVVMTDGTLKQRSTSEGSAIILDAGVLRVLDTSTEELEI